MKTRQQIEAELEARRVPRVGEAYQANVRGKDRSICVIKCTKRGWKVRDYATGRVYYLRQEDIITD